MVCSTQVMQAAATFKSTLALVEAFHAPAAFTHDEYDLYVNQTTKHIHLLNANAGDVEKKNFRSHFLCFPFRLIFCAGEKKYPVSRLENII